MEPRRAGWGKMAGKKFKLRLRKMCYSKARVVFNHVAAFLLAAGTTR